MIDTRLFKAIEDLARVQGGLTGAAEAMMYLYPKASAMMESYADDVKAVGDLLMEIIGAKPQIEVSEVTRFSKEESAQVKAAFGCGKRFRPPYQTGSEVCGMSDLCEECLSTTRSA